jgi:hypothetical protein
MFPSAHILNGECKMNVRTLLIPASIWIIIGIQSASAAELLPPIHHGRSNPSLKHDRFGTHIRAGRHIHVRRRLIARKSVGVMCLLPPDVIVARHWNGPQCRYIDNIIVPYQRILIR